MHRKPILAVAIAVFFILAGCGGGDPAAGPGATEDRQPYAGIGPNETLHFTGTEPFWGGEVAGGTMRYATPENPDGSAVAVDRFAGNNGVSWTGMMGGAEFTLAVTPGRCSDGMSDRSYPFVAMLDLGGETREGCAWTDAKPFTGGEEAARQGSD